MVNELSINNRRDILEAAFAKQFGLVSSYVVARAPGRVNLIGEHTDYNDGFVLPAAIDREMLIAALPADSAESDNLVEVYSVDYDEADRFSLDDIAHSKSRPWANYVRGTLAIMQQLGHKLKGFKAVLSGNVPQGAGLSSSAAFEVAVATLVNEMNGLGLSGKEIALLAQRAENEFIGVKCGIMDQFVSALGERDSALFIDCRSLEYERVPLNLSAHNAAIVIINSGVRRALVDSEYNARRVECFDGAALLGTLLERPIRSLRDVSLAEFLEYERALPPVIAKRCKHVVSENQRVLDAVDSMRASDLARVGQLMNESHRSLQLDFEVSCEQVDALVQLAWAHPGVFGARMTGAGFGGCVVAFADNSAVPDIVSGLIPQYESKVGVHADVYVCKAANGAQVL